MTTKILGCLSFDAMLWGGGFGGDHDEDNDITKAYFPLARPATASSGNPAVLSAGPIDQDQSGGNPGSRGGLLCTAGDMSMENGFLAPALGSFRYITYHALMKIVTVPRATSPAGAKVGSITAHRLSFAAPQDTPRITWLWDNGGSGAPATDTLSLVAETRTLPGNFEGSGPDTETDWQQGLSSLQLTIGTAPLTLPYALWALQIDIDGIGVGPRYRILRDGVAQLFTGVAAGGWITPSGGIATALLTGVPGLCNGSDVIVGKSGTASVNKHIAHLITTESDVEDTGLSTGYGVYTYYPTGVVSAGGWTAVGVCNLSDLWRPLDDPEDVTDEPANINMAIVNTTNDYIVGQGDALFTVPQLDGASATVFGVYIAVVCRASDNITKVIAKQGATTVEYPLIISAPGGTPTAKIGYAFLQLTPSGVSWDGGIDGAARFNAVQFGVRNTSGVDQRVYGMMVGAVGIGLARQAKAQICPPGIAPPVGSQSV